MKKRLKINGVIMFIAFWVIAFFPALFFRSEKVGSLVIDQFAETFGIAFILLGQILRVSARGFKAEHSQGGNALIQEGPYAVVRNPMYLGILLIGLGIVLMLFKWWVVLVFLAIFIIRYILLILKEEKKLKTLFPEDYPDYQKRVPRIFPSLAVILTKDISDYFPLKISWLKKEIGPILIILFLTLLVESWEDIAKKGLAVYFKEAILYLLVIILFICLIYYLSRRKGSV